MRIFIILFLFFATACNNSSDHDKKSKNEEYKIDDRMPPSGGPLTGAEKTERLDVLISESKRTLDSIDFAYSSIRKESHRQALSLDEREQVNEALIELNDAKDLIVLEMQETVITGLKEKASTLVTVMKDMSVKSEKLVHIAQTLSRVSGVIEKTTNLLAGALSVGLVRPRIIAPAS